MTTLTITNIPEELLVRLQEKAKLEQTSVQEQIIKILDANLKKTKNFVEALEEFYKRYPIEENDENEERYDFDSLRSREPGREVEL